MTERRTRINDRMRIDSLTAFLGPTLRNPFQDPSLRVCTVYVFMDVCTYMDINVYMWRERTKVHLPLSPSTLFLRQSFHWTWSSLMGWAAWPVSGSGNLPVSAVLFSPSPQHCVYKNELSCLAFYLDSEIFIWVLRSCNPCLHAGRFLLNHLPSPQRHFCEFLHCVLFLHLFTCLRL